MKKPIVVRVRNYWFWWEKTKIYLKEIDIVINKIILNMHVEIVDLGSTLLENGKEWFKFEVISIRDELKIL